MANKIVREIIHAKGIDIGIYTKNFERYRRLKQDENSRHFICLKKRRADFILNCLIDIMKSVHFTIVD